MKVPDIVPVKEIYNDAFSPAMKQLGGMLESTMKVARFFAAPVEYAGAFQGRWQRYLKKIAEKVPEENLIEGHPQIVVPSLERLVLTTEDSLLSELFINLLKNSVDKTQQELAHPAFPSIIKQLSHDEAVILFYLKKFQDIQHKYYDLNSKGHVLEYYDDNFSGWIDFSTDNIHFSKNLRLYIEHMSSLNLLDDRGGAFSLNAFGNLFGKACIPDEFENL